MSLISREAETTCFRTFFFPFQEKKSVTISQVKSNCLQGRLQTDFVTGTNLEDSYKIKAWTARPCFSQE